MSIDAHAVLSGGRFMTTQECLDTFGSSFPVTYFDGTDFVETTASYQNVTTLGDIPSVAQTDYIQAGRSVLAYSFQGSISSSPEQIQIDISPQYSLFDIDQLHTIIMTPAGATYTTPYTSPQWVWMFGGVRTVFEGLSSSNEMYRVPVGNTLCLYAPVDWESQSLTSGYSVRAVFSSGSLTPINGSYWIYIGVPYVTDNFSGSNGTPSSSSGTTGNINVNVDLSETNSILDDVKDAITGIWSGITGVFVPSSQYIDDWKSDITDLLDDSFGRYSEVDDLLDDVKDSIIGAAPSSDIALPAVSIPNTSLQFQARTWHVIPEGWSFIVDYIKFGFDILFTCLFVNTVRQRLRTIIHGETLVEVEGVD